MDLVVARYREDVSWLDEVVATLRSHGRAVTVHLYDKGGPGRAAVLPPSLHGHSGVWVTPLQNVGREAHTYLTHMISVLEGGLPRAHVTVFLQGRVEDHLDTVPVGTDNGDVSSFVLSLVTQAALDGLSSNHACHTRFGPCGALPGFSLAEYPHAGQTGMDLRQWFTTFVSPRWPDPPGPSWYHNAMFAVRGDALESLRSPDGTCARLRALSAQVSWHVLPEAAHFMERSWRHLFDRRHGSSPKHVTSTLCRSSFGT